MPALNDVLAGSQAQAVQLQQVIDALKGTPNKGVPVALVSLNDPNNYALTVQNDDPVNSRALSVLKADGTTLISADATGVTLGAPVNVPAGALNGTQLANASVTNAKLGSDTARANLLTNGGFEIWQRGNGPFTVNATYSADRWLLGVVGTDTFSISRDTANVDVASGSKACAAVVFVLGTGAGGSNVANNVSAPTDGQQLFNRVLAFSMRVKTSTANAVRIALYTGSAYVYSTYHTGGGAYETLTVTATMGASGGQAGQVAVNFAASCTAYIDNAMLVVGSVPADYAPLHPADDLARCLRYFEHLTPGGSGFTISGAVAAGGQPVRGVLFFKAAKPVTPTVTKVGTWSVGNCPQPTVSVSDLVTSTFALTATAAGDTYAFNSGAGSDCTIESNP